MTSLLFLFVSGVVWAQSSGCETGQTAFTAAVHPVVRTHCATCHSQEGTGEIKGPYHSDADSKRSYGSILGYVNFTHSDESHLIRKFNEKHWENYGGSVSLSLSDLKASIERWWNEGQKDCPVIGKYVTEAVKLPGDLSSSWSKISFRVDKADSPGNVVEVQVRRFSSRRFPRGGYQIQAPRVIGKAKPLLVSGIHLLKNGYFDPLGEAFSDARGFSGTSPETTAVLSSNTVLIAQESADEDTLTLAFDDIVEADMPQCRALEDFQRKVLPVYVKNDCYYCHGGGPGQHVGKPAAVSRFPTTGSDKDLCKLALLRSYAGFGTEVPLIALPLRAALRHPWVIAKEPEVVPSWIEWIDKETKRRHR